MAEVVEVVIRDEASEAIEKAKQRFRSTEAGFSFGRIRNEIKLTEAAAARLGHEISTLARLSSVGGLLGGFLGGGLIAGIAALTKSLSAFSQAGLQAHYTARELGVTRLELERLTSASMVLGQSQQEARAGVENTLRALADLRLRGGASDTFQKLAQGKGGATFAQELYNVINGPGGLMAGYEYLTQRAKQYMKANNLPVLRMLKDTFGTGSISFAEIFDVKDLHAKLEPSIEELKRFNLEWVNTGISMSNVQTRVALAVMPGFANLANALDQYLAGPGKKLVDQFAAWLDTIKSEDIENFVNGIAKILTFLKDAFTGLDNVVQAMGGWRNVLAGIVTIGIVGWLGSFAGGLKAVGALSGIITLIAATAALIPAATGAEADSGGGGGDEGEEGDRLPPNAAPTSGGPMGGGGTGALNQERQRDRDMAKVIGETTEAFKEIMDGVELAQAGLAGGVAGAIGGMLLGGATPGAPGGPGGPGGRGGFPGGRGGPGGGDGGRGGPGVPADHGGHTHGAVEPGSGMVTSGGAVRLNERGAHGYSRGNVGVEPWLIDTVRQATRALPEGYSASVISTVDYRARTPWHPSGRAIDITIYGPPGPDGKRRAIPNVGSRRVPGYALYERMALAARQYANRVYPNRTFIWGGHFHSGVPFDRMHFQSGGISAEKFSRQQLQTPVLPGFGVQRGDIPGTPPAKPKPDASSSGDAAAGASAGGNIIASLARPRMRTRMGLDIRVRSRTGTEVDVESEGGFRGNTTITRERAPAAQVNPEGGT